MSGIVQTGIVFGIAATLAFVAGLLLPLPCLNVIIAFGSVFALGWGAGWTTAKTTGARAGQGLGRGATAGAIGGVVVLVLIVIAYAALANIPAFREAQIELSGPGAARTLFQGAGAGFCLGLINLGLMAVGGAVGGMFWQSRSAAAR